ncbi:phage replisome organizer N-terminal domain-containing protein [Clostridium grantii]|uniref:Phage replisome organizer, putative, N-terminal region n=1 Tax=Clostridium grantii DSM 8605 TaxID=1121316 RepID=A0A1M5WZ29_9CLOT|nr:phage replisome organizer N-terminal domain-containing protein [Clostridium grantii]SHH92163.1 phage replisome organizer, putative, N-terminal region [Clostridium grantii DSM 8605]
MATVKWIKLSIELFDDEKIDFIQSLPEGDSILVIWVRLLVLAGKCNDDGYIYLTEEIPYTEDTLAFKFRKQTNIVKLALETFQRLNMISVDVKGIQLCNWSKYQNLEGMQKIKEQTRKRVAKHRQKKNEIEAPAKEETCCNVTSNVTETLNNAPREKREERREKKEERRYR